MADFLDDLLPIRRLLIDGVPQQFRSDVDFVGAQIADDPATQTMRVKFGLRVATFSSGDTLRADYLCLLLDSEDLTPSFVLPAPSTWQGQRILAKRLDQAAASATITVAGGALIDGLSSFTLTGTDAAAEFWSTGTEILVGPTTSGRALPTRWIILGQSNAASAPPQTLGVGELTAYLGADLRGYDGFTSLEGQIVEGSANTRANAGGIGTGQGPGLGIIGTLLMRQIADTTGQTVKVVAQAYTSRAISYFRDAAVELTRYEDGTQHGSLNTFDYVVAASNAMALAPTHILWVQGEADAGRTEAEYLADLQALKTEFDTALGTQLHWVIITTIGNGLNDFIGTASVMGVRRAQRAFAAANPGRVTIVDTSDMRASSAHFAANHYSPEFGSFAGSVEVSRRIFAALRGEPERPHVTPIRRISEVYTFDHVYWGVANTTQWFDSVGTSHLTVQQGTPLRVASSPSFGGRAAWQLDSVNGTAGEELGNTSLSGANANLWTVVIVLRQAKTNLAVGANRVAWLVQDAGFANRLGLLAYGAAFSGAPAFWVNGGSYQITSDGAAFSGANGIPNLTDEVPRVIAVTYDGTAGVGTYYVNGRQVGSRTGLPNANMGGVASILRVGALAASNGMYDGQVQFLATRSGTLATAQQIREVSDVLIRECELEEA